MKVNKDNRKSIIAAAILGGLYNEDTGDELELDYLVWMWGLIEEVMAEIKEKENE